MSNLYKVIYISELHGTVISRIAGRDEQEVKDIIWDKMKETHDRISLVDISRVVTTSDLFLYGDLATALVARKNIHIIIDSDTDHPVEVRGQLRTFVDNSDGTLNSFNTDIRDRYVHISGIITHSYIKVTDVIDAMNVGACLFH